MSKDVPKKSARLRGCCRTAVASIVPIAYTVAQGRHQLKVDHHSAAFPDVRADVSLFMIDFQSLEISERAETLLFARKYSF